MLSRQCSHPNLVWKVAATSPALGRPPNAGRSKPVWREPDRPSMRGPASRGPASRSRLAPGASPRCRAATGSVGGNGGCTAAAWPAFPADGWSLRPNVTLSLPETHRQQVRGAFCTPRGGGAGLAAATQTHRQTRGAAPRPRAPAPEVLRPRVARPRQPARPPSLRPACRGRASRRVLAAWSPYCLGLGHAA